VSATGALNEETNEYTVDITVEEGERYTFGEISVDSTIPEIVRLRCRAWSRPIRAMSAAQEVEDTIIALTEAVAGRGYAFTQSRRAVTVISEQDDFRRLHNRPGCARLCRAHRNPRQ
jgi:outer membrane protein assembly factor BamA